MPRFSEGTRRRILDAAYGLFYRRGFGRVGVDEIAALAGITKRTLYYHFNSKDELLAAVLELQHELALTRIHKYDDRYQGSAEDIVTAVFSELAKWSMKPGWTGAGFTRLVVELADMPGHPARVIAHRHKAKVEDWWTGLLDRADVASPRERAGEMMLLMEGAMVMILIHGDRKYAATATRAAIQLISGNARKKHRQIKR